MGTIQLQASDGHRLAAYEARTDGASAAVVVIQEVFGVNAHIRSVVDCYAELGYRAIAPAVFDRAERGVELPYTDDGVNAGRALRESLDWDVTVGCDIAAAVDHVAGLDRSGWSGTATAGAWRGCAPVGWVTGSRPASATTEARSTSSATSFRPFRPCFTSASSTR